MASISITKWTIMTSRFDIMHNGPVLDLPLSRQAKVISLDQIQIICYSPRSWCNCLLECYIIPQGHALDSGQCGNANIRRFGRYWSSNSDSAWWTAILVGAQHSEENVNFYNSIAVAIDKLYWLCGETSSLVPHKLNNAKLKARVQISNKLLTILRSAGHQGW
jgi:hypothetical protein